MNGPTDKEIFNHMRPAEDYCPRCKSDDVEHDGYKTQSYLVCGFEPEPPGEE